MRRIKYVLARARFGGVACRARWCARPTVGLSVWCREHTDRICGWNGYPKATAADLEAWKAGR